MKYCIVYAVCYKPTKGNTKLSRRSFCDPYQSTTALSVFNSLHHAVCKAHLPVFLFARLSLVFGSITKLPKWAWNGNQLSIYCLIILPLTDFDSKWKQSLRPLLHVFNVCFVVLNLTCNLVAFTRSERHRLKRVHQFLPICLTKNETYR